MTISGDTAPRTRHYAHFYGLGEPEGDGELALVVGNCQAESLRILLDGDGIRTVRIPAIHEIVASDLPHLDRWLARTTLLVAQPVHDDYHGLPVGTRQLADRIHPGGRLVTVPVIRFAGLYPTHAIVRPPSDPSLTPPLVDYHDLRLLTEAAGRTGGGGSRADTARPTRTAERVRAIARLSLGELRRREALHATVPVSDLFEHPSFDQMRTLNHPGNPVWIAVASRLRERIGMPGTPADPGRPLLDSVHAPREEAVIDAWALDDDPDPDWIVDGRRISAGEVREAHLRWYAAHPDAVAAGLDRHRDALDLLGLV